MNITNILTHLWLALTCLTIGPVAFSADPAPKLNSSLGIDAVPQGDSGYLLKFVIKPEPLVINAEAPWSLELKNASGVVIKSGKLTRSDFDSSIPGFQLEAGDAKDKTTLTFDYKLIAFVCTKDKKQCFRDVHSGDFSKLKK